ncbi:MAG: hypothetical protein G01um101477_204, partial [Candidatus Doudnabacteria bacterium Gr01-1014_77]
MPSYEKTRTGGAMTEWEDTNSSFELPEDESWRGDQHAPQGPDGGSISTWQPGMSSDEADDLLDEVDDEELFNSED